MTIIFGNEQQALRKLLAKKSYDEARELITEIFPDAHLSYNPRKAPEKIVKEKKLRRAFSRGPEGC